MQERVFLFALTWTVGAVLEAPDRPKWDAHVRRVGPDTAMPRLLTTRSSADVASLFDFFPDLRVPGCPWTRWARPAWRLPPGRHSPRWLLVPTIESLRCCALLTVGAEVCGVPLMVTGGQGTGKSATVSLLLEARAAGQQGVVFADGAQVAAASLLGQTQVRVAACGAAVCYACAHASMLAGTLPSLPLVFDPAVVAIVHAFMRVCVCGGGG
jgi:hypothetical protein